MDKAQFKKLSTALVILVIFFALLCIIEFFPYLGLLGSLSLFYIPVFIAALPLILIYAYVMCGYYLGTAVTVIGFGAALLLGFSLALYFAAAFVPLVLTASYMIVSHKRFRTSVVLSIVAALAGAALVFFLVGYNTGMSVVQYTAGQFGAGLEKLGDTEVSMVYTVVRYQDILSGALSQKALEATSSADAIVKMKELLSEELNVLIVYIMVIYSAAAGYIAYIVPRAVAKKQGRYVSAIPKLKEYQLPKRFWIAALVFTAAAFIGESYDVKGFDILLVTLMNVFIFIFMVQGFCFLLYFFDLQKMKKGLKAVLIIIALLFLRTIALPIIGLAENIFGLRKKMEQRKEQV